MLQESRCAQPAKAGKLHWQYHTRLITTFRCCLSPSITCLLSCLSSVSVLLARSLFQRLQLWQVPDRRSSLSGSSPAADSVTPAHWVHRGVVEKEILHLAITKMLASSWKSALLVRLCLMLKPQGDFLITPVTTVWVTLCNNYPDV